MLRKITELYSWSFSVCLRSNHWCCVVVFWRVFCFFFPLPCTPLHSPTQMHSVKKKIISCFVLSPQSRNTIRNLTKKQIKRWKFWCLCSAIMLEVICGWRRPILDWNTGGECLRQRSSAINWKETTNQDKVSMMLFDAITINGEGLCPI